MSGSKIFSRKKSPHLLTLSFAFPFLCALLLFLLPLLLGQLVLLPLHLVHLLLLLRVLPSLHALLLLPVQHLFHVGVLEKS